MSTEVEQGSQFDADYFLRGQASGKSLYKDYRWMPELTIPMCCAMVKYLEIAVNDRILDFGCARGYTVKAFREMGYDARGVDVSQWAIENADDAVKKYVDECPHNKLGVRLYDWVLAKDVLEHVPDAVEAVANLMHTAKKGVFAVVPLSLSDGERYVIKCYEKDVTHIHRLPLPMWVAMFARPGWEVTASYRVRGVKDNYWRPGMEMGNGFITARRCEA